MTKFVLPLTRLITRGSDDEDVISGTEVVAVAEPELAEAFRLLSAAAPASTARIVFVT